MNEAIAFGGWGNSTDEQRAVFGWNLPERMLLNGEYRSAVFINGVLYDYWRIYS